MSWIERVNNDIRITTGDGRVYTPLLVIGTKQVTYNIAEFNFPNVEGTLVKRGTPQGARYDINIVFQGDDNVDISRDFERSCANTKPWTIIHPMYDDFVCHPTSLTFDSTGLNTTRVTGSLVETILEDYPTAINDPQGTARDFSDEHLERMVLSFENIELSPQQNTALANINTEIFQDTSSQISDEVQFNEYFNIFNAANSAIFNASSVAGSPISLISRLITYPSLFRESVQFRIRILIDSYQSILNLATPQNAILFEANAGSIISAVIVSAVTPQEGDYSNSNNVLAVSDSIIQLWNSYIETLDSLASTDPTQPDAYIPNVEPIQSLSDGVFYTISQLSIIALNSQQERAVILTEDSDVINLTHRFYGIDENDINLQMFIDSNEIGISEIFEIKKGRRVIYYV